jgi:hypothetical protein
MKKDKAKYNQARDTARLAYIAEGYRCCDTCGNTATNNDRAYLQGYDDGFKKAEDDNLVILLKEKLCESVKLLKEGKKQFTPWTTNSDVDVFIERNSHYLTES